MTILTARLGLVKQQVTDPAHLPNALNPSLDILDSAMMYGQGTVAARPAANTKPQGFLYYATDENILYYGTGAAWFAPLANIPDNAITLAKMADNSVGTAELVALAVTPAKLADLAVQTAKLDNGAVTAAKINDALKPSAGAGAGTEALRALGTGAGQAAAGIHAGQHAAAGADPITNITKAQLIAAVQEALYDVGDIKLVSYPVAAGSEPAGFLYPDGRAGARATFTNLYNKFGGVNSPYGQGDGSTTFNLPDYRGRTFVMKGTHGEVDSLGDNDGLAVGSRKTKHRHGTDNQGTHNHGGTNTDGAHFHPAQVGQYMYLQFGAGSVYIGAVNSGDSASVIPYGWTGQNGEHAHGINNDGGHVHAVGDAAGPLDSPAYHVVNPLIKT